MDTNQELDNGQGVAVTPGRIRMAYSLQYAQPVLCTLLSDQPLYYMEEENYEDDDSLFDHEEGIDNALLGDLGVLQKKISIYDETARKFAKHADARLDDFRENASCFGNSQAGDLNEWIDLLSHSRYGQSLVDFARSHNVSMTSSCVEREARYDIHSNSIAINTAQSKADGILTLVKALRRHAQYRANAADHPLSYHPDEAILVNRAQFADLSAAMIRTAWELQLAGEDDAWSRLENSQGADLARSFAREALCDFRTLNNGRAAQAVFESWFLSDRCKIEDRELIQAMLADQENRVFSEQANEQQVGPAFIAALGEQTLGKNYLSDLAGTILNDPIFSDVRDRSNANFLWFVKFERSYAKIERAVPEDGKTIHILEPGHETLSEQRKNKSKTMTYELSADDLAALQTGAGLDYHMNQSNVVYVSFGRSF